MVWGFCPTPFLFKHIGSIINAFWLIHLYTGKIPLSVRFNIILTGPEKIKLVSISKESAIIRFNAICEQIFVIE